MAACVLALVSLVGSVTRLLAGGAHAGEWLLLLVFAALLCTTLVLERISRTVDGHASAQPRDRTPEQAIIGCLAEGLVVLDPQGHAVTCNAAAERILGVSRDALAQAPLVPVGWRLVRDDGTPLTGDQHPARVTQRTGAPQHGEVVGLCRLDGSVLWLSVSAMPLPVADSPASRHVVFTFSDITRQRQREHALIAREAQILRALALAPFALWSVDGRGRFSFFAGTAGGGATRWADLTGRPAVELFPGAPEFAGHLRRALSGESFTALIDSEQRAFETRYYPSHDASGGIDGASGISVDVTARVAAETEQAKLRDALRRAAEEWRTTFDAIDIPLLVLGADDTVRRINRATQVLWNEPFEGIIGSRLPDEAPGLPWAAMSRAAMQCRATGSAVTLQERDDASEQYWDVTACRVGEALADSGAVILMARDISHIVELRESLRRSERMSVMGALVSGVAHQVRNPLFAICATLDACEAEHGSLSELREYAQALRNESARLSRLMSHLLEYGKAGNLKREPGSVAEVVASAMASCRAMAKDAGVTVVAAVPQDLPVLALDEGRLQEAFHNVIENAVQHSARDGQVRVAARRESGDGTTAVVCDIDDDGPGFRLGDERHLFEPFFSRRASGTGLGMSIAQRIVHEHGGHISAGNRPGGGARVTIALPLLEARASAGERDA